MMKTHSAAFVCLALALLALLMERQMVAALAMPAPCGQNQHYESCGTNCPATCANSQPQMCTQQCVSSCFCDKGYVFLNDEKTECVPENQCP
ncbi:chymotrypsin-elastase inhibitor ixodidin-like [Rhinatrema bivittatum]|uniref:chymotrypsin-elastase inhibitor ixodidin-like n=1 Tax=Rhinatrema bivittatum TaxID=194408 RepID=UPI001129CA73|nr:chymotrypsin-elastase inhibitor ixodidin-like [Rhinatrema bivittatum]